MSTRQLLDPRWHWLRASLEKIYQAMDADEKPVALNLLSGSADGEMLVTVAVEGQAELDRRLMTDESAAIKMGDDLMRESSVKLREAIPE